MINLRRNKHSTSWVVILVTAAIGFLDSTYLAYVKIAKTPIYCTPGLGDCELVNSSRFSTMWGIPIAVFGMATFAAILLVLLLKNKVKFIDSNRELILFAISLVGFLYSLYLTYLELFVINAVCQWCLLSAIMISSIFITSVVQLVKQPGDK